MSEPDARAGWTPLTAEIGGRTYAGAWQIVGHDVLVVGDAGTRQQRIGAWDHPQNLAERLLIELNEGPEAVADPPSAAAQPKVALRVERRAARPPNNLVGLALLAVFLGLGVGLAIGPDGRTPLTFGFVIAGWILAVMAHEFAHAYVAHLGGDTTVAAKGYLAFDPRRYGDVGVTLVIPLVALALGGIGFPGGAVYIRNDLIRTPAWRAATALAGPGATLLVLLALTFALNIWSQAALPGPLFEAVAMLAFLQAMALILNLLPVPGLDGYAIVEPYLDPETVRVGEKVKPWGLLAVILLLFYIKPVKNAFFDLVDAIYRAMGGTDGLHYIGYEFFKWWTKNPL
jgi:Zn-dependent protease